MSRNSTIRRIILILCVTCCTALIFLLQYRYDNKYQAPGPVGSKGVLDLRGENGPMPLSILTYGWEFYPQQLIRPGSFDGQAPVYVYLGQYGGFETDQAKDSPHGCATYRLTLLLPPQPEEYALELPEIYCASQVYINGMLVSRLGDVSDPRTPPSIRTGMITFQAAGQAELVVWAADSRHYYSGLTYPPAFGSVDAVSDLISFRLLRTCLIVIASLTIGLLYLVIGLKLGGTQKRMTLFAGIGFLLALHVVYPILHLFGAGYWSYHLEDVSFYLFLTAIAALHCSLCGIRGRARLLVLAVTGGVALLSLTVPSLFLAGSLTSMMIYSVFLDVYTLILFGWLIITALFNREQRGFLNNLLLAGLCIIAVSLLAQDVLPIFEPIRFGWQTENAGFIFLLLLAGGLWLDTVHAYTEREVLSENMRLMKNQFVLQEENYRIVSANFEETRRMRHDLRHHLNAIGELIHLKQYDTAAEYLEGYEDSTGQESWPVLCDNPAANAVLTYYQQTAKQKEIPLTLKVSLPAQIKLENWKLGVLLGNLLENALEASEKLPPGNRSVTVYAGISKRHLVIIVKNKWIGDFSAQGTLIPSTKHSGLGIGLSSVRSLVEESGGQFYVRPNGAEFEVSVVLWRQV